jgi:uncharacterized OB-fold protein
MTEYRVWCPTCGSDDTYAYDVEQTGESWSWLQTCRREDRSFTVHSRTPPRSLS